MDTPVRKKAKITHPTSTSSDKHGKVSKATSPSSSHQKETIEQVMHLPLELVVEVFSHVLPRDIWALLRTSKVIRSVLLDKRTKKSLWDVVLANANDVPRLPACVNLSPPAWIHLLYCNICHRCGSEDDSVDVVWKWSVRFCSQCRSYFSYNDHDTLKLVKAVDPRIRLGDVCAGHWDLGGWYSKREVDTFVQDYGALLHRPNASRDCPEVLAFLKAQRDRRTELTMHARRCHKWIEHEEALIRRQRLKEIVTRVRKIGWNKEVDFLGYIRCQEEIHRLDGVARQVDDLYLTFEWSQVSKEVNDFLHDVRQIRTWMERLQTLEEAIVAHHVRLPRTPEMTIRPPLLDLAFMEECRTLVDALPSRTITIDDFLALLPDLSSRWLEDKRELWRNGLRECLDPIPAEIEEPLDLAIALWVCSNCQVRLRFPAVLAHTCAYSVDSNTPLSRPPSYSNAVRGMFPFLSNPGPSFVIRHEPYNSSYAARDFIDYVQDPLGAILVALGLDPSMTLAEDLEKCTGRLRCKRCVRRTGWSEVYGWEAALHHAMTVRTGKNPYPLRLHDEWTLVADGELPLSRKAEAIAHVPSLDIPGSVWACSLCTSFDAKGSAMKGHLFQKHAREDYDGCIDDGTVFVHPIKSIALMKPPVFA
ncbi:hypothetical protein C8Q74DRAFT_1445723 [Fomes fomentarius]|nr:hypothetical protein C8Q74DRAFT_1445723 [Fomes fomentarius]